MANLFLAGCYFSQHCLPFSLQPSVKTSRIEVQYNCSDGDCQELRLTTMKLQGRFNAPLAAEVPMLPLDNCTQEI